jgi:HlyD family secretion protein
MNISGKKALVLLICVLVLAGIFARSCRRSTVYDTTVVEAGKGGIEVWTITDGYLESRDVRLVMSQLNGPATVVEAIPDGTPVKQGDAVARFDSTQLEKDVLRLDRDYTLAREDMNSLTNAKLPLEIRDLELKLSETQSRCADESQSSEDDQELLKEGLLSEKDVQQQETRMKAAKTAVESLEWQLDLTKKFIHPSIVERAKATLSSAEQELDLARRQLSNCTARASASGVISYKPLVLAGEFRTLRVGDTVFRNQPFMTVSDMTNLIMYCDVYEAELSRFAPGCAAFVVPTAFPDLVLDAVIESIGSSARTASGRASGQKFFSVVIRLNGTDPRLRSGMSAQARVLSYSKKDAILAPRLAVSWEQGAAWCYKKQMFGVKKTKLTLGTADESNYEVLDGVQPGDHLVVR